MVKSFALRILLCIDLHFGVGVVTKLLTTRLRSLYTIHFSVPFYGNDWHLTINYMRGTRIIIDPLDWFSQASCLLVRGACSAWLIFSDNLSPYQGNLFRLSDFLRQPVYTWGDNCSTWFIFSGKLSPHGEIKCLFNWFFGLDQVSSCKYERNDWQLPFMVMSFHIWKYLTNKHLSQLNRHYFFCFATVKLLQSLHLFQIILLTIK